MCNIGDKIKLKKVIAGSSSYVGYVHAFHPTENDYFLIRFPGCTFGHDGDMYEKIYGKKGSREFWWLRRDEFTVTEQAETPVFTKLMIE